MLLLEHLVQKETLLLLWRELLRQLELLLLLVYRSSTKLWMLRCAVAQLLLELLLHSLLEDLEEVLLMRLGDELLEHALLLGLDLSLLLKLLLVHLLHSCVIDGKRWLATILKLLYWLLLDQHGLLELLGLLQQDLLQVEFLDISGRSLLALLLLLQYLSVKLGLSLGFLLFDELLQEQALVSFSEHELSNFELHEHRLLLILLLDLQAFLLHEFWNQHNFTVAFK